MTEELKQLVRDALHYRGDDSYYMHIANHFIAEYIAEYGDEDLPEDL